MRPPSKRVWKHLHTNANVPKRPRSGPVTKQARIDGTLKHLDDPRTKSAKLKKKTNKKRGQWSKDDMQLALEAIATKKMSIRQAGDYYGIPSSSIQDWKKGKTTSKVVGHQTYLTEVEELALVQWCFSMQKVALCVTLNMLKFTIKSILQNSPRKHPFREGVPGDKWWALFKQRHPEICLRYADGLEVRRALGFTRKTTSAFYNLLQQVYSSQEYHPSHIWNSDETGVSAGDGNSTIKVVAKKGSRAVRFTCADNKEWMSIMTCVNTAGFHIPNLYIFKRKTKPQINYIKNCEASAAMTFQENGYMTSEIFLEWLGHFKNNIPGGMSKENKHLLILDGHASHVTNEAIKFGRENGLEILTLPSHCSHELQPLDVAIFHPFKLNLALERMNMMRNNPKWAQGATMKSVLAEMSSKALAKALKPKNVKSGFATTGIYPLDITAMDSKLGSDTIHEEKRLEGEHFTQSHSIVPEIFSQMTHPPVLSPVPNLFPELDMCIPDLFSHEPALENLDDIIESLSQLSLAFDPKTQTFSLVHTATNYQRLGLLTLKHATFQSYYICFKYATETTHILT